MDDDRPALGRVATTFLQKFAAAWIAAVATSFVVGGLGGRLVMRILAFTPGTEVKGAITENGNRAGIFTAGGTLGLIAFVTLFGAFLGASAYLLTRRWVPGTGWKKGLAFGVLLTTIGGPLLIDPENKDFAIFGPHPLGVVLFLLLPFLYGLMMVPLAELLERFYRTRPLRFPWLGTYAPLLLLIPIGPVFVPVALAFGLTLLLTRSPQLVREWRSPIVDRAGRLALALILVSGAAATVMRAMEIEPRDVRPADFRHDD